MIVANLLNYADENGIKLIFYDKDDMFKTPINYNRMNEYNYKDFVYRKIYMIHATDKEDEFDISLY